MLAQDKVTHSTALSIPHADNGAVSGVIVLCCAKLMYPAGKTTAMIEIILQEVKRGNKVTTNKSVSRYTHCVQYAAASGRCLRL